MEITKELAQDIRSVESKLIEEFNLDVRDQSFKFNLLFNDDKCTSILKDCVVPLYCQRIYKDFIKPIYFYLEWVNNYISVECIADHHDLTKKQALALIDNGRYILNTLNKVEKG